VSSLAVERAVISGADVAGAGTTYTTGATELLRLETLTFTLSCDATAVTRLAEVFVLAQDGSTIFQTEDRNDVSASWTVFYTFGIGLEAFCGVAANQAVVRAELPDTWLPPGAAIRLASVDTTGAVVAGDTLTSVVLFGISQTATPTTDVIPLLTPIQLADQAAA